MFSALLVEGKEPPLIEERGDSVKLAFLASELSMPFRIFVVEEEGRGRRLLVDHLLILQHLLRHPELDIAKAAHICQRHEAGAREVLSEMERNFGYLERGGAGQGTYWTLSPDLHRRLSAPGYYERDRRIDWERLRPAC